MSRFGGAMPVAQRHGGVARLRTGVHPDVQMSQPVGAADYIALLKPRVMSLVVFTGLVGLVTAPGALDLHIACWTLICMAAGAGGCGALNMWYDADIDQVMRRTQSRPIPRGKVSPVEALVVGLVLSAGSVIALAMLVNALAAFLLAFTIAFYIVVYTVGLKRRTPQNIVIGGTAGALPPMIGWAAQTGTLDLGALALFMIIFLWTPPHFWALAIARSSDYEKAGIPMMPVVRGPAATARQILVYTLLLIAASFAPLATGIAGTAYAGITAVLDAVLLWRAVALLRCAHDREAMPKAAMRLFGFSILYLFAIYVALLVGAH